MNLYDFLKDLITIIAAVREHGFVLGKNSDRLRRDLASGLCKIWILNSEKAFVSKNVHINIIEISNCPSSIS